MKQTWKKMAGLMLASVCAFSLAACGSQEEAGGFQRITDEMAENCVTVSQQAVESLASFDESQLAQMEVSRDDFTRYAENGKTPRPPWEHFRVWEKLPWR